MLKESERITLLYITPCPKILGAKNYIPENSFHRHMRCWCEFACVRNQNAKKKVKTGLVLSFWEHKQIKALLIKLVRKAKSRSVMVISILLGKLVFLLVDTAAQIVKTGQECCPARIFRVTGLICPLFFKLRWLFWESCMCYPCKYCTLSLLHERQPTVNISPKLILVIAHDVFFR